MYIFILLIYIVFMLLIGWYAGKIVTQDMTDFWVGGHRLGLIASIGTMTATLFHSVNFISWTGWVYYGGWSSNWHIGGSMISIFIMTVFLAGPFRRLAQVTVPDVLALKYGRQTEIASSGVYIFESFVYLVVQTIGMAIVLQTLIGLPLNASIWISTIVICLYTVLGGFFAVAYTDVIQIVIALFGFVLAVWVALKATGGFTNMNLQVASIDPALVDAFKLGAFPIGSIIGYQILWGLSNITQGQVLVRIAAAKTAAIARMALIAAGLMWFLTYVFGNPILGLSARILLPDVASPDMVFPTFIKTMLPPLAGALVLCALIAAVMSTTDSVLLYLSSVISRNIIQKKFKPNATDEELLKISRVTIIVVAILVALIAQLYPATMQWMNIYRATIMGGALIAPILMAFIWKKTSPKAGLPGMISGLVSAAIWWSYGWPIYSGIHPIIVGIVVSIVVMTAVSYIYPISEEDYKKAELFVKKISSE